MIRVGFLGIYSKEWIGGVNYLKNLLYALSVLPEKTLTPIVFIGHDADPSIKKSFAPFAQVIEVSVLTPMSLNWLIWKISKRLLNTDLWLELLLRKYKIDVFSHSDIQRTFFSKSVNWIPDFQHLHLPKMFSIAEIKSRNRSFKKSIRFADLVILSSKDAMSDLNTFAPESIKKVRVLNFVAQPKRELLASNPLLESKVLEKLEITEPFFYLPNQFWKHKNHKIVFEALAILKNRGISPLLICSGRMNDYRSEGFFEELKQFVETHSINVRFLGLIDYDEVIVLMKKSIAVINPSLFEGWSSTVEECKAIGKSLILSNIAVHREQNPAGAHYFNPNDQNELANVIQELLSDAVPNGVTPIPLDELTLAFAKNYQAIILEALKS